MIVAIMTAGSAWRVVVPGTMGPNGEERATTLLPHQIMTRFAGDAVRVGEELFLPVRDVESQRDGLIRLGAIDAVEVEA